MDLNLLNLKMSSSRAYETDQRLLQYSVAPTDQVHQNRGWCSTTQNRRHHWLNQLEAYWKEATNDLIHIRLRAAPPLRHLQEIPDGSLRYHSRCISRDVRALEVGIGHCKPHFVLTVTVLWRMDIISCIYREHDSDLLSYTSYCEDSSLLYFQLHLERNWQWKHNPTKYEFNWIWNDSLPPAFVRQCRLFCGASSNDFGYRDYPLIERLIRCSCILRKEHVLDIVQGGKRIMSTEIVHNQQPWSILYLFDFFVPPMNPIGKSWRIHPRRFLRPI